MAVGGLGVVARGRLRGGIRVAARLLATSGVRSNATHGGRLLGSRVGADGAMFLRIVLHVSSRRVRI